MHKCALVKDGTDCTVEIRETRKCQNKLPQMVYCSHSMVFWHIDTLNNYQIITVKKNHLTAVPFNGTCFTEEAGCTCTAQHGSSCGLNCDSPSPKKCTPVLTPGACESDPNLFGIRIFADILRAPLVAQRVKNPPAMQETQVQPLGWEDPLEKGMATHSSIRAWRIPWTQEPGGATVPIRLQSWTRLSNSHTHTQDGVILD